MTTFADILFGDVARLIKERPHEMALFGRGTTDPAIIARDDYSQQHGEYPEQTAERAALLRRELDEAATIADLQGEPPALSNSRLSPKRTRYAAYAAWLMSERQKLATLEKNRKRLEGFVAAPAETEAAIRRNVQDAADGLLGGAKDGGGANEFKNLHDRLTTERYAEKAAQVALPNLDREIEVAKFRVETLTAREYEFLNPVIIEIADDMGLGHIYMKRLAAFREVAELVFGLSEIVGGYDSGFVGMMACVQAQRPPFQLVKETTGCVTLPRPGLPSLSKVQSDDFELKTGHDRLNLWAQLRQALVMNPHCRAENVVVLPKR